MCTGLKFSAGKPSKRFQAQERLDIDYDLDNFEKKNPTLFAKFYSPNFENPQAFSMLGYGDIALPGLLLMYAAGFDECHRIRWIDSYFFVEIVGYVCGLVLTIAALALDIGGQGGQPALLYLVPCTLIPIIFTSLYRGDFGAMFHANLIFLQSPNTEGGARGGDSSSNRLAHGSIKNDEGQEHELLLAS